MCLLALDNMIRVVVVVVARTVVVVAVALHVLLVKALAPDARALLRACNWGCSGVNAGVIL